MPTWSGILAELAQSQAEGGMPQFDAIRRRYLVKTYETTGRNTVLYASKWTQPDPNVSPEVISIVDEDSQGLMEVIHGLTGPNLDPILHSPGGSAEAAEPFVAYLRSKFEHIRIVVPHLAMSAATLIACAADVIVLGKHSFLGPIDPQFAVNTPLGERMVPAQVMLDQFEQAKTECLDPAKMGVWLPMLSQFGPDLLIQCRNALQMSRQLVEDWLVRYMFRDDGERQKKAKEIATWLCDHGGFKSHGRHIPRSEVERPGLRVEHLEQDQQLQDLLLSVFHATTHTFSGTAAVKIIENHLGKAFIKQARQVVVPMPPRPGQEASKEPPKPGATLALG